MESDQWNDLSPYFTESECGDMDYNFMLKVLQLRKLLDSEMIVHEGKASSGHSDKSYHYKGRALDFHVKDIDHREVMGLIDSCGFGGAGVYYWGAGFESTSQPFFHIDDRPIQKYQRWISIKPNEYKYMLGLGG